MRFCCESLKMYCARRRRFWHRSTSQSFLLAKLKKSFQVFVLLKVSEWQRTDSSAKTKSFLCPNLKFSSFPSDASPTTEISRSRGWSLAQHPVDANVWAFHLSLRYRPDAHPENLFVCASHSHGFPVLLYLDELDAKHRRGYRAYR